MARSSLYRTLVVTSLFAAVGSFVIDLGDVFSHHMLWLMMKLQHMGEGDREVAVSSCRTVIAYASAGLVLVRFMRWWNGE